MKTTNTFTVLTWDERPVNSDKSNFPVNIAHVTYEITGELTGTATVEYLLYYLNSNLEDGHLSTAKIAGYLFFEGSYLGKKGTFTAQENGIFDKGTLDSLGTIIASDGEFSSLSGSYNYNFIGQTSELLFDLSFW